MPLAMRSTDARHGWLTANRRIAASERIPVWTLLCCALGGCAGMHRAEPATPVIRNDWLKPVTIAVAPAINQSGSVDFDPARFADRMATELSYAEGVSVIPVSRVLAALSASGHERVESPAHASVLARAVGADALLVFSVTDYDPYDPPRIGVSAQLYGSGTRPNVGSLDPTVLSRLGRLASTSDRDRPGRRRLLAETQQVFDASHDAVVADIRRYASIRGAGGSPYGWRRYVVSQQEYIEYCCFATIRALLRES